MRTYHTFESLEAGKVYQVCANINAGKVSETNCPKLKNLNSTPVCKNVTTICEPLPKPEKNLTQIDWNSRGKQYDPFRQSIFRLPKWTFNSASGGDLTYFLR